MTYIQQWEQMRDKVRNLEQERQTQLILAPHNAYGFKLNINHPLIRPKWDAFKSTKGLGQYGMTDDLRREFEVETNTTQSKPKQTAVPTTAKASASEPRNCNCWNGTAWCATCGSRSPMS